MQKKKVITNFSFSSIFVFFSGQASENRASQEDTSGESMEDLCVTHLGCDWSEEIKSVIVHLLCTNKETN